MRLYILGICMLICSTSFSQYLDTVHVQWECRVKRTSRLEMEVRITGKIKYGSTIGPFDTPILREGEEMNTMKSTIYFTADSNWNVDMQSTGINPSKYHSDSWSWRTTRYDSVNEPKPVYVQVGGRRRQAATVDSNGTHPVYNYIKKPRKSKVYHTTYVVWGNVKLKRTINLARSSIQEIAALSAGPQEPTQYQETPRDRRRRTKAAKAAQKNYKSRMPVNVVATLRYYAGGATWYYDIFIPWRGMPLHKWIGIHISELD